MSLEKNGVRFTRHRLPKHRELFGDLDRLAPKHKIQAFVEVDVTLGRGILQQHKERTGETVSFTAWVIECLGHAVSEFKEVQAYRRGKELIVFDDVDVAFALDRPTSAGELVTGAVIRKAQEKSVREIHDEIRAGQATRTTHGTTLVGESREARTMGLFQSLPSILRRPVIWWYRRDPFFRKRIQGTVGITSVGNIVGVSVGMSGMPLVSGPYPLQVLVGAISRKAGVVGEVVEPRDYLPVGVMFDHEAVDGAEAARFLDRLGSLLKEGFGLEAVALSSASQVQPQA